MKLHTLFAALMLSLSLASNARAAIQRSADFSQGSSLGLGLYGLSYDYGLSAFSAGLAIQSPASGSLGNPLADALRLNLRLAGRFYQQDGLSMAVIGGVLYDPGRSGDRSYLIPDLGLGLAYDFRNFQIPFALRLNLTLAANDTRNRSFPTDPSGAIDAPNFLQSLSFGPQTSIELAWLPTDNLEVTLGGGTLLGMRFKF